MLGDKTWASVAGGDVRNTEISLLYGVSAYSFPCPAERGITGNVKQTVGTLILVKFMQRYLIVLIRKPPADVRDDH